ncbi:MAG: DUF2089 domain-containing protein [Anaerolineaceae bacterium]|nr:DUF2089 domain-containing protein [Anaerolineaceae bacterium]
MSALPHKCPSCSAPLQVSQLSCTACDTVVTGKYDLSPLFRLSAESLRFLETFILNRGNVKEMERNTGQSYWAIRRRLDEVIEEMDLESSRPVTNWKEERQEILKRLKAGEIDVQTAAEFLRKLGE